MAQREVELILVRQLASYLTIPIFVVDPKGTLIFFNEPAEGFLGRRFDETEELSLEEWTSIVAPTNRYGGNTSCVAVRPREGNLVVLDAGTGIAALGRSLGHEDRVDILLTHLH